MLTEEQIDAEIRAYELAVARWCFDNLLTDDEAALIDATPRQAA